MYSIAQNIDPNKIFIVNRSELQGRIDPDMVLYRKKTNSFRYNVILLKSLLKTQPQYGANESGVVRKSRKEPRYIRITDINEYGILIDSIGVTAEKIENKYILENNDILFVRSGATVGKVYLHQKETVNYECFFAGYMIRFVVDEGKILPKYLFSYTQLSPYREWVKAIQRAAGQPNINAEEYKSLLIPLPSISEQKNIVQIIDEAYAIKQQKETEAQTLLASIDDYLLDELGLTMPTTEINVDEIVSCQGFELNRHNPVVKKGRLFLTMFSEIENRIDPEYYRSYYHTLFNEIKNTSYCKLKDLTQLIDYGLMPTQDYARDKCSGVPFIRVTNILPSGEIDMNDIKYIPFDTPRIDQKRVKENDILMVQCGSTTGKVAIVPNEYENYLANSFSFIIRSNKKIRQDFLFYILGNPIVQMQIVRSQNIVSVRPNTSKPAVENLLIPLPPIEKQSKIALHISEIRKKAKYLQVEATNILENAKQKVEQLILAE